MRLFSFLIVIFVFFFFFFFNDTATTEIYTLSLHDALPISGRHVPGRGGLARAGRGQPAHERLRGPLPRLRRRRPGRYRGGDRKSTRLKSSHSQNSYAVFCLKKKKKANDNTDLHTN